MTQQRQPDGDDQATTPGASRGSFNSSSRRHWRRGGILVEFALVAFIVYLLLAATLSFGRMMYSAQILQQSADLFSRELARSPLPANATFEEALQDADVQSRIYSEDFLVIDIEAWYAGGTGQTMLEWIDANYTIPTVNRTLIPVMFIDEVTPTAGANAGNLIHVLRYPGAVLDTSGRATLPVTATGLTVAVPLVTTRDAGTGEETGITWVPVVEEIDSADDPFQIGSTAGGVSSVRLNYPFQSSTLPLAVDGVGAVEAEDTAAGGKSPAAVPEIEATLIGDTSGFNAYDGTYGFGRQGVLAKTVRPYRKVVAAQSVYRREVFR